jgi:hypothetical protein
VNVRTLPALIIFFVILTGCARDFDAGSEALRAGNYSEAIARLERIAPSSPNYPHAKAMLDTCYYELGVQAFSEQSWEKSIDLLKKISPTSSYQATAQGYLADATDTLLRGEVQRYVDQQDMFSIDAFILKHEGTVYAGLARTAKINLLGSFLAKQAAFEEKQAEFHLAYGSTDNQVRKSQIFNEANEWSFDFIRQDRFGFQSWEGQLARVTTSKGGDVANVKIKSRTASYIAKVPATAGVYSSFLDLNEGDEVRFSGDFVVKHNLLAEGSWTESGRMYNPEFEVHLTRISLKPQ